MLGFETTQKLPLKPKEEIQCAYYARLLVSDEKGVFSQISAILAQNDISLNNVLQKEIFCIPTRLKSYFPRTPPTKNLC